MKALLKLLRLPLDLLFLTVDWLRTIPEWWVRMIKRRGKCTFCEMVRVDSSSKVRNCPAARKYANLWVFKGVCACAHAPTANHDQPHCRRRDPMSRPIWYLPLTGVILAVIWLGIAVGGAELSGYPAASKVAAVVVSVPNWWAAQRREQQEPARTDPNQAPTPGAPDTPSTATKKPWEGDAPEREGRHSPEKAAQSLAKGDAAFAEGDYSTARICYLNARKFDGHLAEAHYGLGRCYLNEGQFANGLSAMREAAELNPELEGVQLALAELYAQRMENALALTHTLKWVEQEPDSLTAHTYLLRIYDETGKKEEAHAAAEAMVRLAGTNQLALAEAGDYYLRGHQLEKAQQVFDQMLTTHTNSVEALHGLAQLQLKQGNLDLAKTTFNRANALDTNHVDVARLGVQLVAAEGNPAATLAAYESLNQRFPDQSEILLEFAGFLAKRGQVERARTLAERVEQSNQPRPQRSAKNFLAQLFLRNKFYREAREYADEILRQSHDFVPARMIVAQCDAVEKKYADAEAGLRSILSINPEHHAARTLLTQVLKATSQFEETAEELENLARFLPDNPQPLAQLSNHYFMRGEFTKAIDAGKRALERRPDGPIAANRLVLSYIQLGKLDDAQAIIDPLYAAQPKNNYLGDAYGWLHCQRGSLDIALPILENVARTLRGPMTSYHLGMAYQKSKQPDLAREHLERALNFKMAFPGDADARETLEALRKP